MPKHFLCCSPKFLQTDVLKFLKSWPPHAALNVSVATVSPASYRREIPLVRSHADWYFFRTSECTRFFPQKRHRISSFGLVSSNKTSGMVATYHTFKCVWWMNWQTNRQAERQPNRQSDRQTAGQPVVVSAPLPWRWSEGDAQIFPSP